MFTALELKPVPPDNNFNPKLNFTKFGLLESCTITLNWILVEFYKDRLFRSGLQTFKPVQATVTRQAFNEDFLLIPCKSYDVGRLLCGSLLYAQLAK